MPDEFAEINKVLAEFDQYLADSRSKPCATVPCRTVKTTIFPPDAFELGPRPKIDFFRSDV